MSADRVLVTVDWLHTVQESARRMRERIESAGFELQVKETRRSLMEEDVIPLVGGVVGYLAGNDVINARVLANADRLRVISRQGAGYDRIDLQECTRRGIVVCNAFGAGAPAVAEFALGCMLAVARRIVPGQAALREGDWFARTELGGGALVGATLGIIGLGHIGRRLAQLVRGLEMRILYYDVARAEDLEAGGGVEFRSLDDVLAEADFVSLHVQLNPHTHHMIGERELRLMKPTAFLINTSRGGVVDELALYHAVAEARIAGAALDVFEQEPISAASPLLTLPDRVLVTPHLAALSDGGKRAMLEMATDNLLDVLQGKRPRIVTNPDVYMRPG